MSAFHTRSYDHAGTVRNGGALRPLPASPRFRPIPAAVAAALMTCLAQTGCGWWGREDRSTITLSGNIELTQIHIAFKVPGRLSEIPFAEGSAVAKGALLARLDSAQLGHQLERDRANVALAESLLQQQQTAVAYQKAALGAEIESRQAALRQAAAHLERMLAGSRGQEKEQARAAVEEARTQHNLARQDWERAQELYRNEDISTAQHDQFRTRLDTRAAALRMAEQSLSLVLEGPRKEEVDAAQAAVEQARAAVRLSEASRLELQRKEQEIETRRAQVQQARAQLNITLSQVDDTAVYCPVNGVVLVKSAETGEIIAAGTTIATIGEIDRPWLRGYINEADLGRVRLGQKVRVTTDSFPDRTYEGTVTFIASEAEFTPKQIQTAEERVKLVYRIKVEIDNPNHELKLNMPADAEILGP